MRDFYATSFPTPLDQADGLRRMFAGCRRHVLALAANPHVAFSGLVLDRVAAVLAAQGRRVLVVDAAGGSPLPQELARVDLAACVEDIAPGVSYLAARGLALNYVDTRGSAGAFIDAVLQAAPQAEILLLHADGVDLARLLKHRSARPLLIGADHPESIKHAYANAKLLVRRCGLMSFDLLLAAAPQSPRIPAIVASLADCAENFLGAVLCTAALIDPGLDPTAPADAPLVHLLASQLALEAGPLAAVPPAAASPAARVAAFADLTPNTPRSRPVTRSALR